MQLDLSFDFTVSFSTGNTTTVRKIRGIMSILDTWTDRELRDLIASAPVTATIDETTYKLDIANLDTHRGRNDTKKSPGNAYSGR